MDSVNPTRKDISKVRLKPDTTYVSVCRRLSTSSYVVSAFRGTVTIKRNVRLQADRHLRIRKPLGAGGAAGGPMIFRSRPFE
jgi:hypothetical protein